MQTYYFLTKQPLYSLIRLLQRTFPRDVKGGKNTELERARPWVGTVHRRAF